MNMFETIGTNNPAYLLADPNCADVIAIPVEAGQGVVARGTVMYRKTNGAWAAATASDVVATNMLSVIDESVDTAASENNEVAKAYRAARLISGKVTLKGGAAITAAQAIILRTQGIVFDQMVEKED